MNKPIFMQTMLRTSLHLPNAYKCVFLQKNTSRDEQLYLLLLAANCYTQDQQAQMIKIL